MGENARGPGARALRALRARGSYNATMGLFDWFKGAAGGRQALELVLQRPRRSERRAAVLAAADADASGVMQELSRMLSQPAQAAAALDALGWLGSEAALRALASALDDEALAPRAARVLSRGRLPQAVPHLVRAYLKSPPLPLRQALVTSLSRIGVPALSQIVSGSEVTAFAHGDLVHLVRRCGEAAVQTMIPLLRSPLRPRVALAIRLLRALASPQAVPHLLPLLSHKASSIRGAAFRTLAVLARQYPAVVLVAIRGGTIAPVNALWLSAYARDPSAIPELLKAAADRDCLHRLGALHMLGALHPGIPEPALPLLVDALNDPREEIREAAATVLKRMGRPEVVPALLAALSDRRTATLEAAYALGHLAGASLVPLLQASYGVEDPFYHSVALSASRTIPDAHALLEALHHPKDVMRVAAIQACRYLDRSVPREPVAERLAALLLHDPSAQVRQAAAVGLRFVPPQLALPPLQEALAVAPRAEREVVQYSLQLQGWRMPGRLT